MKRYFYRVVTSEGKHIEGHCYALKLREAKEHVQNDFPVGTFILELKATSVYLSYLKSLNTKKIDLTRKLHFTRQIQSLLSSGVTMLDTLHIIANMSRDKEMKKLTLKMIEAIGTGLSFSQTCRQFGTLYTDEEIALIRAGEASGVLDEILADLYHLIEWDKSLREKIVKALRYPAIVITTTLAAMIGIFTFIIPMFASFFTSNASNTPFITSILLKISHQFVTNGPYILLSIFILIAGLVFGYQKPSFRKRIDTAIFYVPIAGTLYKHTLISRSFRIFSILYAHGISVLESLIIIKQLSANMVYQEELDLSISNLKQGIALSQSMSVSRIFAGTPAQVVNTGERGGTLAALTRQASEFYRDDITFVTDRIFTYLEPATILFIGIMVLCLSLGVFLPMINIITTVGN